MGIYPIIAFVLIYYLMSGGSLGLEWVETGAWGGLSLTFIISFFCLIFCFPIGMAFALGRRSGFPLIRYISIGFIEFWRGVPLITVLFMSFGCAWYIVNLKSNCTLPHIDFYVFNV